MKPNVLLSTPQALRLPLTWIGILYGRLKAGLAATSGVHEPEDVIKLLTVGASVTMLCSTLLRNGPNHLRYVEQGVRDCIDRSAENMNTLLVWLRGIAVRAGRSRWWQTSPT